MLAELSEADAHGEVASIYAEVRSLCAVPYVSSLHRHLATRAGWLEWCWAAVRPAFASGAAQSAAWEAVSTVMAPPLPALSASAARLLGVDDAARGRIRDVCESFIRVSPTNLMLVALVRAQLVRDPAPASPLPAPQWTPPQPIAELPQMVDPARAEPDLRATMLQLGNEVAGRPFVPGLYRMLAHWPAYLAHAATELGPRFADPRTAAACRQVATMVADAADPVIAELPPPPQDVPRPPPEEHGDLLGVMERYRKTSPEMVVFGTLLRDALPQ